MLMDDDYIGKVRTTTISDLPVEVLAHVMVRLSVKDILACVCVQKSWHSLIKNPTFRTLYSNYHSSTNPNKYLLFWDTFRGAYEIRVDDIQCEKYLTPKYPLELYRRHFEFRLVSNGLICLFYRNVTKTNIYLWNPVIQKYITLPHSPSPPSSCRKKARWNGMAFGFVQEINDYVVVHMAKYGLKNKPRTHYVITCVYNLSTNSWKQITHHNTHIKRICLSESIIVNGIAIWIGYNSHMDRILVCFDTKTEMLRKILSPKSLTNTPLIRAFDQSIVYIVEKGKACNEHDMWILKGDPMNEFVWEKKMMIREGHFVRVLGLRNNGEPILRSRFNLISYNLGTHKPYDFVESWNSWARFWNNCHKAYCLWNGRRWVNHPFIINPFAESLGLLDIDSTKYFARSHVN